MLKKQPPKLYNELDIKLVLKIYIIREDICRNQKHLLMHQITFY